MTTLLDQARRRERERIQAIEDAKAEHRRILHDRLTLEATRLANETFQRPILCANLRFPDDHHATFQVDEFTVTVCLNGQSSLFALTARCPTCLATWTVSRLVPSDLERLDSLLLHNYAAHEWHDPHCPSYNPDVPEYTRGVNE